MPATAPGVVRALVVGAHPDDAELFAGGAVAAWCTEGAHVELLVLTDGRLGSWDPAVAPDEVARARAEEAEAAAKTLGVARMRLGRFPDGGLAACLPDATALVARTIREVRPDVLVAHDPWRLYELHPDHRAAGTAACDGMIAAQEAFGLGPAATERLAPHRTRELWLAGGDHPNHFVDVAATFERKLDALACHESQLERVEGWRERVREWNARIGAERGHRLAEAFRRILPDRGPLGDPGPFPGRTAEPPRGL